jgi:hypothetical protein
MAELYIVRYVSAAKYEGKRRLTKLDLHRNAVLQSPDASRLVSYCKTPQCVKIKYHDSTSFLSSLPHPFLGFSRDSFTVRKESKLK